MDLSNPTVARELMSRTPMTPTGVRAAEENGDQVFLYVGEFVDEDKNVIGSWTIDKYVELYGGLMIQQTWQKILFMSFTVEIKLGIYVAVADGMYKFVGTTSNANSIKVTTERTPINSQMNINSSFRETIVSIEPAGEQEVVRWKLPGGPATFYAIVTEDGRKFMEGVKHGGYFNRTLIKDPVISILGGRNNG